jgi:hypothetical protein
VHARPTFREACRTRCAFPNITDGAPLAAKLWRRHDNFCAEPLERGSTARHCERPRASGADNDRAGLVCLAPAEHACIWVSLLEQRRRINGARSAKPFMTIAEVMSALKVSRGTVRNMVLDKKLRVVRPRPSPALRRCRSSWDGGHDLA